MSGLNGVWHVFDQALEPIRCIHRINGKVCGRAQDLVGEGTVVRVRLQTQAHQAIPSSVLRICRSCEAKLEVNVAAMTKVGGT